MEFEQIVKRMEWVDEEHRKTKSSLITLEERMMALEANIDKVAKQIKPLGNQIADIAKHCRAPGSVRCHIYQTT